MTRARDNSFNPFNNQIAGKNFVINGNFDFWQRGTSFAAAGAASTSTYTADRWASGANSNITISRVSASTEGSTYALRIQKNSGTSTGGDAFVCHVIESSNSILLAGKTVTLSFNVRKGADFSGSSVYCVPRFGTGADEGSTLGYNGQWTGSNQIVQTVNPTTNMVNYQKTFTVPSGTKEIMLLMGVSGFASTSSGTNDWIEFEKIQLEVGSVATLFSRAGGDIQGELAKCERYYWSLADISLAAHGSRIADTDGIRVQAFNLPQNMRSIPSVSFEDVNGVSGSVSIRIFSTGLQTNNVTNFALNVNTRKVANITKYPYGVSGISNGQPCQVEMYNLKFNAEL